MNNRRNYYRILHVQPDAPVEIIKSSYRTLMQRLRQHPDLGGEHWNAALINEAYRVLTNNAAREQYDHDRELYRRASVGEKNTPASDEKSREPEASSARGPTNDSAEGACEFCFAPHRPIGPDNHDSVCPKCASPLIPATEWRLGDSGQRAINRIPANLDIEFYTTWPQSSPWRGCALDVSPNGMQFAAARHIGEGRRVKIVSDSIEAVAVVVRCRHDLNAGRWIVGVAFSTLRFVRSQGAFYSTEA